MTPVTNELKSPGAEHGSTSRLSPAQRRGQILHGASARRSLNSALPLGPRLHDSQPIPPPALQPPSTPRFIPQPLTFQNQRQRRGDPAPNSHYRASPPPRPSTAHPAAPAPCSATKAPLTHAILLLLGGQPGGHGQPCSTGTRGAARGAAGSSRLAPRVTCTPPACANLCFLNTPPGASGPNRSPAPTGQRLPRRLRQDSEPPNPSDAAVPGAGTAGRSPGHSEQHGAFRAPGCGQPAPEPQRSAQDRARRCSPAAPSGRGSNSSAPPPAFRSRCPPARLGELTE